MAKLPVWMRQGQSGRPQTAGVLHPESLQISLKTRSTSTAQMQGAEAEDVQMHDFVEIFTAKGSAGLFWVTGTGCTPGRAASLSLRHAVDTLSASVWKAQEDYDGTVAGYLRALLAQQNTPYWQLGVCEDAEEWARSGINYDPLNELLDEMIESERDYYCSFDFSTWPWTLNFLRMPDTVSAEFRLSRNVETCQISRSDADQCTRLHLSITREGEDITSTTTQVRTYDDAEAQALYGVIERTAAISTKDVKNPEKWAREYLAEHNAPAVQISVSGRELYSETGEEWDEYDRGRMVRVALPEYGEAHTARIEAVNYPNAMRDEAGINVEIANQRTKFSGAIASLKAQVRAAGGAARGAASKSELKHWAMIVSDHREALDGTGLMELWETGIVLDAVTGAKIYSLNQGFESQYAAISVNATAITSEVRRATEAEGTLSSRITQNANSIALVVENGSIKAAQIVAAINSSGSSVTISADHIVLDGDTIADAIKAKNVILGTIMAGACNLGNTSIDGRLVVQPGNGFYWGGYSLNLQYIKPGTAIAGVDQIFTTSSSAVNLEHYHDITATESGGVVTITQGAVSSTAGTANFNIAATAYFQNAVAAARAEGAASASVDDITAARNTNMSYDASTKIMSATWRLTAIHGGTTNLASYDKVLTVPGNLAYNAGRNDVTIASDSSHLQWATTSRSIGYISGTITAIASNGAIGSRTVTNIAAPKVVSISVNEGMRVAVLTYDQNAGQVTMSY